MKRRRDQAEIPDADIPLYPDYDSTLTSGIDDTVRNLKVIRERSHSHEESERLKYDALKQLTDEVRELRAEHARMIESTNRKASKGQLKEFSDSLGAKFDRRVDNIFKLVAALGAILGVLIAVKGH